MSLDALIKEVMAETQFLPAGEVSVEVSELTEAEQNEVLAFLAERPLHTVAMAGLIRDHGLQDARNRGTFYGCRNSEGRLEGVALIGHATLIETRTRRALSEFALVAQAYSRTHMILGERERIAEFWNYYADEGQEMRVACRELLFECRRGVMYGDAPGLRPATLADLDLIVPVHAALAESESGVNPLEVDPEGFRQRCARRIERGRVWVLIEEGRLIFKADIQSDTPDVIYLEGIYVHPAERGKGMGRRCMARLCRELLRRTRSVSLLVNEGNERAHAFYRLCNFKLRAQYDTLFLQRRDLPSN